jgi:hypothetical protein
VEHSQSGMSRHMLIMVLCCAIPMVAIAAIAAFRIPVPDVLRYGVILLCPLSHFAMMAFMGDHKHEKPAGEGVTGPGGQDKGTSCH